MKKFLVILTVGFFNLTLVHIVLADHTGQPHEAGFGEIMIMGQGGWTKLDPLTGSAVIPTDKELDDRFRKMGPSRPRPGSLRNMGHDPDDRPNKDR
ncbi:hypothetical protein LCGC14_1770940 [marine sediment metagenome]|uniref:Uncharacterized protein n=1 Tax=marine sediment metagenome TaxID=412755 RepID=A0A0F9JY25_9ZZZZ